MNIESVLNEVRSQSLLGFIPSYARKHDKIVTVISIPFGIYRDLQPVYGVIYQFDLNPFWDLSIIFITARRKTMLLDISIPFGIYPV